MYSLEGVLWYYLEASTKNQCKITLNWNLHHDDVIKWKHSARCWPFVRGIHRSPVNSPHKGRWGGALLGFFICAWINGWVNNRETGDLGRHRAHYDVTVMWHPFCGTLSCMVYSVLIQAPVHKAEWITRTTISLKPEAFTLFIDYR